MNKQIILTVLFLTCMLNACAPDPRKQAEADRIIEQAQQDALNQTQQRQQSADLHALEMQQRQVDQANREARTREWQAFVNNAIYFGGWVTVGMLCVLIVMSTRTIVYTIEGVGAATVQKAEIAANVIHLDANGNFPALIKRMGGGKWSLTDLNTKTTMLLDVRNDPDAQMVAGAIAIRHDVSLADQARRSQDGGESIVTITPPIIQRQFIDVDDVTSLLRQDQEVQS